MKHIAVSGLKRFLSGAIMALVFFFVPTFFNFIFSSFQHSYYMSVSTDHFLRDVTFQIEDMCVGDSEQLWFSNRIVGVESGISANITRELYKILTVNETRINSKIYEETRDIVIDPVTSSSRIQRYPFELSVGEYVWQLKMNELRLPSGVVRTDMPILRTNIFTVSECDTI